MGEVKAKFSDGLVLTIVGRNIAIKPKDHGLVAFVNQAFGDPKEMFGVQPMAATWTEAWFFDVCVEIAKSAQLGVRFSKHRLTSDQVVSNIT